MCGPLAIPLAIASAAVTATGQVVSGIQAKQQADYQAKVAEQNANLASQARREAIDKGVLDQVQQDRQQAQLQGQQRVALAGSGVDTTYGTAADLASDSALIGSENRQINATNTDRVAEGYSIQAMNDNTQAQADRMKGSSALTNSLFQAGGTILGGATQVKKLQSQGYGGATSTFKRSAYGISGSDGIY